MRPSSPLPHGHAESGVGDALLALGSVRVGHLIGRKLSIAGILRLDRELREHALATTLDRDVDGQGDVAFVAMDEVVVARACAEAQHAADNASPRARAEAQRAADNASGASGGTAADAAAVPASSPVVVPSASPPRALARVPQRPPVFFDEAHPWSL